MSEVRTTLSETTAIASGDPEAFARFYEQWFDTVYADARRLTGRDESFCLDVTQDVFMRCIRSMRSISAEPALRVWLQRVVHSTAIDRLRADARRRRREITHHELQTDAPTEGAAERLRWLEAELVKLEKHGVDMLLMRHRFGWTLDRIGATLGLGPGAVDGRLRRTVAQLRNRAMEMNDD